MQASKVYFTDLRAPVGTSQLTKLQRLIRAAGIGTMDFERKMVARYTHYPNIHNTTST